LAKIWKTVGLALCCHLSWFFDSQCSSLACGWCS